MTTSADPERLTVVIPAFNEAQSIGIVVEGVRAACGEILGEIIVVDDGSTDGTGQVAEGLGVVVISHNRNRGYGASLKDGIRHSKTSFVLTIDGDGQHRPEDIPRLWDAREDVDMVIGARQHLIHSQLWRMPGKWLLRWMANYLTGRSIPDLNSGMRLIRREVVVKYMHLCPSGFSFSTTITMALETRGYQLSYIPIDVRKRVGQSTVTMATGLETILLIVRVAALFNSLRLFLPLAAVLILTGCLWGVPYLAYGRGLSITAMLFILTGVILFALGIICDQISQLRLERYE